MKFDQASKAIDWLHGARFKGVKNGLENMRALTNALGSPERCFRCVHIAGTNGKGSTAAMTERALREAGHITGLYTSPYLIKYNERVQVCGKPIPDDILVELVNQLAETCGALTENNIFPTTFELGTALAFLYFKKMRVDIAVLEVGLGGRFDSTNVVTPEISMIAAIGFDHMKILGDTLEQIAFEKAGIIKPGVPVVVQNQAENVRNVFKAAANERGSALTIAKMPEIIVENPRGAVFAMDGAAYEIPLAGSHQLMNAALSVTALKKLGVPETAIRAGLKKTVWPCRLEWISGVLIDGGHNPQGARALRDYLEKFYANEKITLVTGMMHDKQTEGCAKILAPVCANVITTAVDEPRAALPEELAAIYASLGANVRAVAGVENALAAAKALGGVIVCAGSLYIAGAVRALLAGDDCFSENA